MSERPMSERETIRETTEDSQTPRAVDVRDKDARRTAVTDDDGAFLPSDRMDAMRERWTDIQAGFVDNPRSAVTKANQLVASLVDELTNTFARERTNLENQWSGEGTADTEDLRVALQRYRAFFNRLLTT